MPPKFAIVGNNPITVIMGDDLPLGELYQQREEADLLEKQRQWVAPEPEAAPAASTPTPEAKPTPPDPAVMEKLKGDLTNVDVRGAADKLSRALFGMTIDQWHDAVVTGTLSDKVGTITNVGGNVAEEIAKDDAKKAGLDPETTAKVVSIAGLMGGVLFPAGGGKGGAAAKVEKLLGKAAKGGINVERVEASAQVKQTIQAINDLQAERLATARKTVTHAQTVEESQRLGMTVEQAATLDVAKYDMRAVQMALRDYHNSAATLVDDLMRQALKGDENAAVALNYAFATAGDLSIRDEMLGKLAARGLEARKIKSLAERAPFTPEGIKDLSERMAGGVPATHEELVERGKTLAQRLEVLSRRERQEFARQAVTEAERGRSNILYEAWLNWGLLSSPQTHIANVTSNALTALTAPAERTLSAMASSAEAAVTLGRHPREVFFGEAPAMLFAIPRAFVDGLRAAGKSLATGTGAFGPDKVEKGADATRRLMLQNDDTIGHATGFLAAAFRAPTRALTAEDSVFKMVNYRMELYALAYREATQQGLKGEAFAKKVGEIIRTPPEEVAARAQQFALVQTFNRELSDLGRIGQFAQGASTVMDALPAGRLLMPFVRTPANLMHFASERTPILNFFSDTLRRDILHGGPALRAQALGKASAGALAAGTVMHYAASGLIVGGGPSDPAEREMWMAQDGRKPYSMRLGDQWVTFGRLDPMGLMMGTVADSMEVMSRLPDGHPVRAEIAAALTLAFAKNMVSKTYLQGMADLFSAFSGDKGLAENLMQVPRGLARSVTPSIVRTAERTEFDPERSDTRTMRQVYDPETGKFVNDPFSEVQRMVNEIKAGIPGLSSTLPPMRNRYGEAVLVPPGYSIDIPGVDIPGAQTVINLLSPMYSSKVVEDSVSKELARLQLGFRKPLPVVFGNLPPELQMSTARESAYGVELNPKEADRLYVLAGQGGMAGNVDGQGYAKLPTFRDMLGTVMTNEGYKSLGDAGKRLLLEKVDADYKKAARAQLLKESPGLQDLIELKLRNRANDIKPGAGDRVPAIGPGLTLPGGRP